MVMGLIGSVLETPDDFLPPNPTRGYAINLTGGTYLLGCTPKSGSAEKFGGDCYGQTVGYMGIPIN